MNLPGLRTIHSSHVHYGWDNALSPQLTIAPGETVTVACRDAGDGQIGPGATDATIRAMEAERANPLTGPIFVDGARPGDTLKIDILDFSPSGFGWTAIVPGFGLLSDQFPDPKLHLWSYERRLAFGRLADIPLAPFVGTIGNAPADPGPHSVIPPRRVGGNMDVRDLREGATLYLPVEVEGALLSVGDTHAAQGDGEVCGTAIESAMDVTIKVDLVRDTAPLAFPRYETSGPRPGEAEREGVTATTGIGPDLLQACRDAVSGMIDHLASSRSVSAADAYMLCSVVSDLRISEVVDAPNWVVSCAIPRSIFTDRASV